MSEITSIKTATTGDESKSKGKTNQAVVDYLQAPRKKRKSYVILAVGPNLDSETVQAIQRYMRTQFGKLAFIVVKSVDDFIKYSTRNIILAIVDDELTNRTETLQIIKRMKEQKTDGPMPTLFLTKDATSLVKSYQDELSHWHEVDEYAIIQDTARHALFNKIKSGIDNRYQRRGRRYKISMPIQFQVLDTGPKKFKGMILDFSVHGAQLSAEGSEHHFSPKDQIVVHMPISDFIKGESDVIRISARVRRVLISGDKAGVTWEYISEDKLAVLTQLLTVIVDRSLSKAANATRAKIARVQADEQMTARGQPKPSPK